jgi:nicotinamide mononucleotide adenylyltransferase
MTTITLKINENTKKGKAFLEMARVFFENSTEIILIEEEDNSLYNPDFVAKIKKASTEKGREMINAENLWESIE